MELRMSQKERDRLRVIEAVAGGKMKQARAAEVLKISVRQVRRIVERWREQGDAGLVHQLRGRASNRKTDAALKSKALKRVKKKYNGFGPTLAAEYLAQADGIEVSRETLRKWMMEAGLWKGRKRGAVHRQWRARRECFGEMVQMDTSIHDWFEGRSQEKATSTPSASSGQAGSGRVVLIFMIDDATSRLEGRFFDTDSTATNMAMIGRYIQRHGRPLALYADRASHFLTTRGPSPSEALEGLGQGRTQIGRALSELGIEYIAAYSPQAKGRVERSFKTAQDRVVKGLRVEGISMIQEANEWLEKKFIPLWNERFAVAPACGVDVHRRINRRQHDLAAILSEQQERRVGNDYTVQFENGLYQIEKKEITGGLRGSRVIVERRLDGSLKLRWRGAYLKFHAIEKRAKKIEAAGATPVGLRPPCVAPAKKPKHKPPPDHPWKRTFLPGRK